MFQNLADEKACCFVDASQNCLNLCVCARALMKEGGGKRDLHDNWPGQSVFSAIILAGISAARGHMKELWEAQQVLDTKRLVF